MYTLAVRLMLVMVCLLFASITKALPDALRTQIRFHPLDPKRSLSRKKIRLGGFCAVNPRRGLSAEDNTYPKGVQP